MKEVGAFVMTAVFKISKLAFGSNLLVIHSSYIAVSIAIGK
jgi:hypothetical protein